MGKTFAGRAIAYAVGRLCSVITTRSWPVIFT